MFDNWVLGKKVNDSVLEIKEKEVKIDLIKKYLGTDGDVNYKEIYVSGNKDIKATLIFIDGLVSVSNINDNILKPLTQEGELTQEKNEENIIDYIVHGSVYHVVSKVKEDLNEVVTDILNGFTALIVNEGNKVIVFETKGFEKRGISDPTSENVLKGSKDAFVETLRVNTALVRRKIKTPDLKLKEMTIGTKSKTQISIIYMDSLADKKMLNDLIERVNDIKSDNIIAPTDFEEYIVDNKYSMFPQVLYTERTDKFCANIMDGKIGIIIDGLPIAYVIPATFSMFLQAPEDYSDNYIITSFIRIVRYMCIAVTLLLPALYIAITTFHQEMIPTELAMSIIRSKDGVPFPSFVELILMLLAFEVLIEAGLRLPKPIGQSVSIIGGLVMGQAAVSAKIVSPAIVVLVAITGIAGFVIPNQDLSNSFRICRLLLTLCSAIFGLFGVSIGVIVLIYYLSSIEIFGIPYMVPYEGNEGKNIIKDTFLRLPNK